jgi:predicted secreted hydrolase
MYPIFRWLTIVAAFILLGLFASGAAYGANASGYCYLEGQTNHAGTKVDFYRHPLGAVCYTTSTKSSGYYHKSLMLPGDYDVIFSHPGFITDGLARVRIEGSTTLPPCTLYRVSCEDLGWHRYPYVPPGTSIWFPEDEGKHNPFLTYPIEWWYVNFHLTGRSTGREYGAFIAVFKDGPMRLFSISDLYQQQNYTHADLPGFLIASTSELDLRYTDEIGDPDIWRNMNYVAADLDCDGGLMPFTYRLAVDATAREDGDLMKLDIIMASTKAPMIVGGDGLIHVGDDSSYYYSHTKVKVLDESEITVHGLTEQISGYAWIDHQWGDFLSGDMKTWEWLSIKLDDLREIMVADVWVNGELLGSDSSRFNFFNADCSLELSDEYTITRLAYWEDPQCEQVFATQWRIQETSKDIDLIVTADYDNQMMQVELLEVFPLGCFWEGVCSVTGTIGGMPVSGKAYAELTHSHMPPPPPPPCEYVGPCVEDMYLYWHEENPPTYYYTEQTSAVRDGAGGVCSTEDRIWFLMNMGAEETRCYQSPMGLLCARRWNNFGLIACYDPSICDTLYTIRLPSYGSAAPSATYHGLAYNDNDGTFWYSRPLWPVTWPPCPPQTTLYHIDGSGNELGSFPVEGFPIVGLALDADHKHLWCIALGEPDMFLEYDVSSGEPVLIQGPFQVPWSSPDNSAAGLEYHEEQNTLIAIDKNASYLVYFCDVDRDYPGPPGPGEPGVFPTDSCVLSLTPWGVAFAKGSQTVFVASSSGRPFALDEYASLAGRPRERAQPLLVRRVDEEEHEELSSSSYPNPFNPATEISYVLPNACDVELSIFNVLGQRVTTLVNEYQAAGHKTVRWDGTNKSGSKVASGVYFYQIRAGEITETKKMILMK